MTFVYKYVISTVTKLWLRFFFWKVLHSYVKTGVWVIQTRVMGMQMNTELYIDCNYAEICCELEHLTNK